MNLPSHPPDAADVVREIQRLAPDRLAASGLDELVEDLKVEVGTSADGWPIRLYLASDSTASTLVVEAEPYLEQTVAVHADGALVMFCAGQVEARDAK